MLRTEFRFPVIGGPRRLLAFLLGEPFLGFLAIVAVALTLFPMLFTVNATVDAGINAAQWTIIGWFAFEYLFALASARAKFAFLTNVWRLIDLVTIVVPLVSLLPTVSQAFRSTPALRLIRLARLITLGVRVSGIAARRRTAAERDSTETGALQITLMANDRAVSPEPATWEDLLESLRKPSREWLHVSSPSRDQLAEISAAASLPPGFLDTHLVGTSYPHLARTHDFTLLFVWLPEIVEGRVERSGLLLLAGRDQFVSIARRASPAVERMAVSATAAVEGDAGMPFADRTLALVLQRVLQQDEQLVGGFEQELRALEEIPIRDSTPTFFERTFRLKKELSATQADLWRLKGVVGDLAAGRAGPNAGSSEVGVFPRLNTDAEYLYETVINLRDEVLSVIELHLNIVSFDMNRVMRVLAVVSVLGLIPAVVGGLFGMNLIDNPWPFTLPQVAFTVSFSMVLCLYLFFVKGWLR